MAIRTKTITFLFWFEQRVYPLLFFFLGYRAVAAQFRPSSGAQSLGVTTLYEFNSQLLKMLWLPAETSSASETFEILAALQFTLIAPLLGSVFCVAAALYLLRRRAPVKKPDTLWQVLFPLSVQLLLLAPLAASSLPSAWTSRLELPEYALLPAALLGAIFTTIGGALSLSALFFLGRCFSISAIAVERIISGPYRWMNHPMYTGEVMMAVGWALFSPSLQALLVACILPVLQLARAHMEEQILDSALPA